MDSNMFHARFFKLHGFVPMKIPPNGCSKLREVLNQKCQDIQRNACQWGHDSFTDIAGDGSDCSASSSVTWLNRWKLEVQVTSFIKYIIDDPKNMPDMPVYIEIMKFLYFELSPPWITMTFIRFVAGKSSGIVSDISSGILSGISSGILSGRWGPAVGTELGRSQVEVQRCALSWEGPRLRSSSAHWAGKVPGWGPAVRTELRSWRRAWPRVGKLSVDVEVEAEVVEEEEDAEEEKEEGGGGRGGEEQFW